MKKILVGLLLISNACVFAVSDDDFIELDEPYQYVTGAYWGVTVGPTFVKHKLTATDESGENVLQSTNISKTQFDYGLMAGFGTSFYKDYYVGLEMEMLKRAGKGVHKNEDEAFGLRFQSQFGLNMNVRFGYLFPKQGNMVYAMVGFSRTLGKAVGEDENNKTVEQSFGSYFPIVGVGIEHKINYDWNIRLDAKYSITSRDSDKKMKKDGPVYGAKPQSIGIRLSITRNI